MQGGVLRQKTVEKPCLAAVSRRLSLFGGRTMCISKYHVGNRYKADFQNFCSFQDKNLENLQKTGGTGLRARKVNVI